MLLCQRELMWLRHVHRMEDRRIHKDLLYGQLAIAKRSASRPFLRYRDVYKWDMQVTNIVIGSWETKADDRTTWRADIGKGVKEGKKKRIRRAEKGLCRKEQTFQYIQPTDHICSEWGRDCRSKIGLISHTKTHNE